MQHWFQVYLRYNQGPEAGQLVDKPCEVSYVNNFTMHLDKSNSFETLFSRWTAEDPECFTNIIKQIKVDICNLNDHSFMWTSFFIHKLHKNNISHLAAGRCIQDDLVMINNNGISIHQIELRNAKRLWREKTCGSKNEAFYV